MRGFAPACLALALLFGAIGGVCAQAQRFDSPSLDKQLKSFDPKAVQAARHYYSQPALKAGIVAMTDNMGKAMMGFVAQQNPGLSQEQQAKARRVVGEVMRERIDLLLEMSMISALQTFTTDELVAMDKFYSSPVGMAITAKMPQLSAKLPAMMQAIMPDYLNEIRERMKKDGAEVKL